MCTKCKQKHVSNPRLQSHKIVHYQQMIFNANKFGQKKPGANGGESDNNTSVSPSRRGTASTPLGDKSTKSPKLGRNNNDGMSMISGNSSGRFSRNMFGNAGGGTNESVRVGTGGQDPLELMNCPSHEGLPLDHYSLTIREFMCKMCLRDIEGTQREVDLNPVPLEEAMKVLESRLNMQ